MRLQNWVYVNYHKLVLLVTITWYHLSLSIYHIGHYHRINLINRSISLWNIGPHKLFTFITMIWLYWSPSLGYMDHYDLILLSPITCLYLSLSFGYIVHLNFAIFVTLT